MGSSVGPSIGSSLVTSRTHKTKATRHVLCSFSKNVIFFMSHHNLTPTNNFHCQLNHTTMTITLALLLSMQKSRSLLPMHTLP